MKTIGKEILKALYPKRPAWCYKGNYGKLLVIGGSKIYSGSPAFASMAAYRAGVDLVTTFSPKRAADIIATFSPDLITHPVNGDFFNPYHVKEVLDLAEKSDAVVIGGGMERRKETLNFVVRFLEKLDKPCVVDADAIYAVAKKPKIITKSFLITPHSYEFFVLTRKRQTDKIEERANLVLESAKKLNCTILLKGCVDVISDGNEVALNRTGNPAMTKGGTGDTLTGICGALLAMGSSAFEAACGAAYINGLAGDMAASEYGQGMLASDMLVKIGEVVK